MWKFAGLLRQKIPPHQWNLARLEAPGSVINGLRREGYVRPVSEAACTLTPAGLVWVKKHGAPERLALEAQYLVVDFFREQFELHPTSYCEGSFDNEYSEELDLEFAKILRALVALESVGLIEAVASNSDRSNTYTLTELGKQRCSRPNLLEDDIELEVRQPNGSHIVTTTVNVGARERHRRQQW